MPFEPKFWEDSFWVSLGNRVWYLFEYAVRSLDVLGDDDSGEYVRACAELSKGIVEKLSEYFELSEPVVPEMGGAEAVIEFMRNLAEFCIGRDHAITLAWTTRFITIEYVLASYPILKSKPDYLDKLFEILGSDVVYEPPSLFRSGEIDLTVYGFPGYLDDVSIEVSSVRKDKEQFVYKVLFRDKSFNVDKQSLGSLLIKLGLLAWHILSRKPGILSIFETTDARTIYLERASTRIPSEARDSMESIDLGFFGDGRKFYFEDEYIGEGGHVIVYRSDPYKAAYPIPKACKEAFYYIKGGVVYKKSICMETTLTLSKTTQSFSEQPGWKANILQFLRTLSPYIFLGIVDIVKLKSDQWVLVMRG